MKEVIADDDSGIIKVYKEKPYLNSNREPFGLTIKSKSKEYIHAHETIKGLIIKGKEVATSIGKLKILDAINNKAMINAIVEVTSNDGIKGNAELKVYNPSLDKKKGATIEMRKVSDSEYIHVEKMRNVVTDLLDCILAGKDSESFRRDTKAKVPGKVTSKPKLFTCDVCSWKTKFGSALKAHMKRMHSKAQPFNSQSNENIDTFNVVNNDTTVTRKRSKVLFKCENKTCDFTFECSIKLREHILVKHGSANLVDSNMQSPCSSPPRKKFDLVESEEEMLDLDNVEINIENEFFA